MKALLFSVILSLLCVNSTADDSPTPWKWEDQSAMTPTGMWFMADRASAMCVPTPMQVLEACEKLALRRGSKVSRQISPTGLPWIVITQQSGKPMMAYASRRDCQTWLRYFPIPQDDKH